MDGRLVVDPTVPDGYDDVADGMANAAASDMGLPFALTVAVLGGGDFNDRDARNFLDGLRTLLAVIDEHGHTFKEG